MDEINNQIQPMPSNKTSFLGLFFSVLLGLVLGIAITLSLVYFMPEIFRNLGIIENNTVQNSATDNNEVVTDNTNELPDNVAKKKAFNFKVFDTDFDPKKEIEVSLQAPLDSVVSRKKLGQYLTTSSILTFPDGSYLNFSLNIVSYAKFTLIESLELDNGKVIYKGNSGVNKSQVYYTDNLVKEGSCGSLMDKVAAPCSNTMYDSKLVITCTSESSNYSNCDEAIKTLEIK